MTKTTVTNSSDAAVARGFVVDVVNLLRWPGSRVEVSLDEPLAAATSAAHASRLHGSLIAESMPDSLTITGDLVADWSGECRRCLGEATGTVDVDVQEIYERKPEEGETFELTDDKVDLEPMLTELVTLTLPLAPLCGEDCLGPAPDEFPATVEADPSEEEEPKGDPRWAALDALTFEED